MSEITHTAPASTLSLEERRDRLSLQDATLTTQRKVFARDLHKLKKDWGLLYPKGTARQFILWFCQGDKPAKIEVFRRCVNTPERGAECAAQAELYRLTSLFPTRGSWGENL